MRAFLHLDSPAAARHTPWPELPASRASTSGQSPSCSSEFQIAIPVCMADEQGFD